MSRYRQGIAAEKRVAKATGGRTQPGSGSRWHAKGDVKTPAWLGQVKATAKKTYSLKLADLQAIEAQAAATNREPMFLIEFTTPQGRVTYAVTRCWDM
jgi:hypothetical protein